MAKSKSRKLDPELWEAYDALVPIITNIAEDPEISKAMNDSIIADLLGDPREPAPKSKLPLDVRELLNAVVEVHSSVARFDIFEIMFSSYPWKRKISLSEHLKNTYLLMAHESYIFEERLKKYFAAIERSSQLRKIEIDVPAIRRSILRLHKKSMLTLLAFRGQHVHRADITPDDLERIILFELLDTEEFRALSVVRRLAITAAKKKWKQNAKETKDKARALAKAAFQLTRSVWKLVAEEHTIPHPSRSVRGL
jgi:hypothetical protein